MRWMLLTVVVGAAACGPKYHTAAPYRFNLENARDAAARAVARCRDDSPPDTPLPPKPFVTDGCSMSPDGVWQRCCVEHDMRYWCGGTRGQRREADDDFRACIAGSPGWGVTKIAPLMRFGVRLGGVPWTPFHWRWGYGHPWPHGYLAERASTTGGN